MAEFQDLRVSVNKSFSGLRLDQALAAAFDLSRRRIRRCTDEGGCYINSKRVRTAGRTVSLGDTLRVVLLEHEVLIPLTADQLVWQDKSLFLLHKKAGQYSQEALHRSKGTLPFELAEMLAMDRQQATLLRPVHRLDRGTSGLILYCSDPALLQHLQQHWQQCVDKRYLAVVDPAPEWESRRITSAISQQRDSNGCYHVSEGGRACDSEAKVIKRIGTRALIELIPHTGRTHQLRVHLSSLGCPILGDARYGGKSHSRLMLHAHELRITPPGLAEEHAWQATPEEDWKW